MFDCHCHLTDERLAGCLDAVIDAAVAAGVTGVCTCGTSPADWHAVAELATHERRIQIVPAFGVHPWFATEALPDDWLAQLTDWLTRFPDALVGEIGLDRMRGEITEMQRTVFDAQLALATRMERPVVCHGAKAWGYVITALKPYAPRLPWFLCHGFSRAPGLIPEIVALGGYVSIGGGVCNHRAVNLHALVRDVPADRLLIETDSPDMFPEGGISCVPGDEQVNQPANLPRIAEAVAQLKSASTAASMSAVAWHAPSFPRTAAAPGRP